MITTEKTRSKTFEIENSVISCRLCNKPAKCNNFICYKKKQGVADCSNCAERLCQHHWRIFFRKNI